MRKFKNPRSIFLRIYKLVFRYFDPRKRNSKDKKIIKSFQQHYLPNSDRQNDQKTLELAIYQPI